MGDGSSPRPRAVGLDVDLIIGTSAGSAVAAALTSGISLEEAFERQTTPAPATTPAPPVEKLMHPRTKVFVV